jgi:hypothetical protein
MPQAGNEDFWGEEGKKSGKQKAESRKRKVESGKQKAESRKEMSRRSESQKSKVEDEAASSSCVLLLAVFRLLPGCSSSSTPITSNK